MNKQIFEINSQSELKEIIENNEGILILDFTSPTCPPCLMLIPVLEELASENLASIAKIDVFENSDLANEYNVQATPTLLIFKNNEFKKMILGYQPIESWKKIIAEI